MPGPCCGGGLRVGQGGSCGGGLRGGQGGSAAHELPWPVILHEGVCAVELSHDCVECTVGVERTVVSVHHV